MASSAEPVPRYVSFLKQNRTREQAQEIYAQRIADAREVYERFGAGFQPRSCPFCGSDRAIEAEKFDERYGVSECERCSSRFVNPAPGMDALSYYYNECECNAQLGALLRSRVGQKNVILSERGETVLSLIEQLLETRDKVTVLEIGCNSGAFLHELNESVKARGLAERVRFEGVDIDRNAVENAVSDEITLHARSAEDFAEEAAERYDLVMHFELIEHLFDPYSFMQAVHTLLTEGGLCHFHTPNGEGFDNVALGYNDFRPLAHGIFPPMHLQAFTPRNLLHFAIRAGFDMLECTTPGNFDVDMVRQFVDESDKGPFHHIARFDEEQLAIVQVWLRRVHASSHMAATLRRA